MQLNSLQLECQRLGADMTLSFGCIVSSKEWGKISYHRMISHHTKKNGEFDAVCDGYHLYDLCGANNEGHPIDRGRLCYLHRSDSIENLNRGRIPYIKILERFCDTPELYQGNILTRPDSILLDVRDFLLSIQLPCPQQ